MIVSKKRLLRKSGNIIVVEAKTLFPRGNKKSNVDLGKLKDECEALSSFLISKFKANVTSSVNKILVDSNSSSSSKLKKLVNKYVYCRHLNNRYEASLEARCCESQQF